MPCDLDILQLRAVMFWNLMRLRNYGINWVGEIRLCLLRKLCVMDVPLQIFVGIGFKSLPLRKRLTTTENVMIIPEI